MTLKELDEKYNFHDSSLESIRFDQSDNRLEMDIDFCFWMQTDYVKSLPETGMTQLIFNGVQEFIGERKSYNYLSILDLIILDNNKLTIQVLDEDSNEYIEFSIIAETVDFIIPKNYEITKE